MLETEEARAEQSVLDAIREDPRNRGKDFAVIDLAERAIVASGLVIPGVGKTAEIVVAHQAPVTITKETPEVAEWRRQTDRFIDLGFHDALKFSDPETYRLTIPGFFPKPRNWDGRYDNSLAVEVRIPLPKLHQLAGIKDYIDTSEITNGIRIPKKPYTAYIVNSVEIVTGIFDFAMGQLAKGAVASPFIEVDMAYLRYPELFQTWLDAGNSRCGAGCVPCLRVGGGGPGVFAYSVGDPGSRWRFLFRGNKIGT